MSKGVFTFQGGTDRLIKLMQAEMLKNGVDIRIRSLVERIEITPDRKCRLSGSTASASPAAW